MFLTTQIITKSNVVTVHWQMRKQTVVVYWSFKRGHGLIGSKFRRIDTSVCKNDLRISEGIDMLLKYQVNTGEETYWKFRLELFFFYFDKRSIPFNRNSPYCRMVLCPAV